MIPQFRIVPGIDATRAAEHVLALAEADTCILCLDRGPFGRTLVFCPSPRLASAEETRFDRAGRIGAGLCALTLIPDGPIVVEGGGSNDSSERLARFVARMLRDLAPCRVFDEDTGSDLTMAVAHSPRVLFASA